MVKKTIKPMNKTLNYYDENATSFSESTLHVNFTETQQAFLNCLPSNAHILDFGCGAGRDTRYFLERGCLVTAVDGSEALCKIASEYTGISVKQMLFQNLDEIEKYDGIWACASILHLKKAELSDVLVKMRKAVIKLLQGSQRLYLIVSSTTGEKVERVFICMMNLREKFLPVVTALRFRQRKSRKRQAMSIILSLYVLKKMADVMIIFARIRRWQKVILL